jgi:hypothetical protein
MKSNAHHHRRPEQAVQKMEQDKAHRNKPIDIAPMQRSACLHTLCNAKKSTNLYHHWNREEEG